MPYPILKSGQDSSAPQSTRNGKQRPAFSGIPIFLEAHDERTTSKTYGTTPTTPTTPEILTHCRPAPCKTTHLTTPKISPVRSSPTTTIQTSSNRSSVWPIPEPPPGIQHQEPRRPTLHFFPTQRPRIQLEGLPILQIPQFSEKTPINPNDPGLGITHGLPKPPSIEVTSPINEKSDSSFNIAQRIEEKLWRYSASGSTLKRWLLEILSWLFSALCMGAVIGVLIYLEGESLSKWTLEEKTHLTLNTYISILSKMAGAALILPVSEALGQLKWSWFLEHSKQMWDFEIFDNASRGPWGSMLLLLRTKGRALAAVGAMIMLGSLALDPFFQQVVDFPERWALRNNLTGEIPRIARYEPVLTKEFFQHREAGVYDKDLYPIIKEFFYGNGTQPVAFGNGTRPDIPLSCPTSNCTWPEYETLAICSRCEDVSAALDITYACMETTVDWSSNWTGPITEEPYPNATVCGHFLNATSNKPILLSGYMSNNETGTNGEALMMRAIPLTDFDTKDPLYGEGSVLFKNVRYPLLDALIASAPNGLDSVYQHKPPTVHECILSWCVQTVNSSYEFGLYSENITSEYWDTSSEPVAWPWQSSQVDVDTVNLIYGQNITLQPSRSHTQQLDTAATNVVYTVGNVTIYNAMVIFDDFFPSTYTSADASAVPLLRYKNYFNGPYTRTMTFNPWTAPNNLTRHMERLATSMTNIIRSSSTKQMFHGEAYSRENFVQVRWQWLTLPLGLLLISLVFLAATIAKSAAERDRVGVWKTSAYATLLYGLPDEMQNKITRSGSTGTPRSKAKELKVKLQPNGGWRVSGNLFTPFTPKPRPNQPPPGWI